MEFAKMHGCGNDYVYLDGFRSRLPEDAPALARLISRRRFSIGSDGLVYVLPGERARARMRMWNADGSEAEMCGNAIRCVAKLLYERGHVREETIPIETGNGVLDVSLTVVSGKVTRARVAMGVPTVCSPQEIELPKGKKVRGRVVSIGNPHVVILGESLSDDCVLGLGARIEKHSIFPNRTNVEFVRAVSRSRLEARVWERGSGETLACGTGACAIHAAARTEGLVGDRATIALPGGELACEWPRGEGTIFLEGPCELSFEGAVEVEAGSLEKGR
ncbi:diaminopimelate epimerase [bacterium]|nr:diaminopimelate epimerase [bacterium]